MLRFTEFVEGKGWTEEVLGNVTIVVSKRNKSNKKLPVYSINNKEGFLPQAEQFEGVNSNDRGYDTSLYKIIERNTFAYNPARIDVGSIGYSGELHNIIISSLYVCFQTIEDVDDNFIWQFLNTSHFNQSVKNNVEGGIRHYLFYENFSKIRIAIPNLKEQQKIASCLSSLDELIIAHSDKLKAIKNHKNGLMQILFPQDGQKVPSYRFPEFKDDGAWEFEPFNKVYSFLVTNSFSRAKLNYESGSVKNIHYGDIHSKFSILFDIQKETVPLINPDVSIDRINEDNYCVEGDMVFADASEDLKDVGKSLEIINLNNEKLLAGLHTFLARQIEPKLVIGFGGFLFMSKNIRTQIKRESQGAKVLGISKGRISEINIYYPQNKKEQNKIASCLTALDELITAQSKKIEQLQQHKKGLMQGLFPKIES